MDVRIENLKKLSKKQRESISSSELCRRYGVLHVDSSGLKIALRHYEVLSDTSLTPEGMAERIGTKKSTAANYRNFLLKYKIIDSLKTISVGAVKRLQTQRCGDNVYRFRYFNSEEMKAAGLKPEEDYFTTLVIGDKKITIEFLEKYSKKTN